MATNETFHAVTQAETRVCVSRACHGAARAHWVTVAHEHGAVCEIATCLTCREETVRYNGRVILRTAKSADAEAQ